MEINPSSLAALYYAFNKRFQEGYETAPKFWDKVAMEMPSGTAEERYAWMGKLDKVREWVGERTVRNVAGRAHAIINRDYELTVGVPRNNIEDNQLGLYNPRFQAMGEQAAKWPDDLVTTALQAGASTVCWDGQYFFDTDHPVDVDDSSKGTYANRYTSKALTAANFADVRAAMMLVKGEDQRPMGVTPNLLIVPPQLEQTARQLLNAEFIAPAAAMGQNAASVQQTNVLRGTADLLVVPELGTEATTWYLASTNRPLKPLVFQLRKAPQFVAQDAPDSPNVFLRKEFLYGVDMRGAVGFGLPFLMARCEA